MNRKLKQDFFRQLVTTLAIFTASGIGIYIVSILFYQSFTWQGYEFIYNLAQVLYSVRPIIVLLYYGIGYVIIFKKYYDKLFSYMDDIFNSVSQITDGESTVVELPYELKHIEGKLNHTKITLQENERLAKAEEQRKNDLIVYLAHDIKTPLTSVIGYLSLLDEVKDMPVLQREKYTSVVLDKAYRLEDLINELFDIARYNDGTMTLLKEEINLNLMLDQIVDDFYPVLKETNKSITMENEENIHINVDSDKIGRVLNNIINNAIAYSENDSNIDVKSKTDEHYAYIDISNYGQKISQEKLDKVFDKFYRMDSARTSEKGGSGLGLAIAKDIIELHEGSISATNIDYVTTFHVILPLDN